MKRITVLSHIAVERLDAVARAYPTVRLLAVPLAGDIAPEVRGEVLLTLPWGTENLPLVLERGVRWVHAIGTGVDRFPLSCLGPRALTCSRGASAIPIAEWVLAVMLAFEKRLPESWVEAAPPRWSQASLGRLHARTLGLIGFGGIAREVAVRAQSFGMRVRALRRSALPSPVPGVEIVRSLEELLCDADHIVVAAPATAETRHLIGCAALAHVKRGAHLVNVARGGLVDLEALRAALDDGRIARASLDTVEPEPLPAGHWAYTHPGIRLSPHISWSMDGAFDLLLEPFVVDLGRYRAGEPLLGLVDVAAGY